MRIQRRLDPNKRGPAIALVSRHVFAALILGWLAVSGAIAEVSEPAGFVRLVLPGESALMVSMPFDPYDSALDGVFSNQLQGAAGETAADRILHWDRSAQTYRSSFKADNTGDPERDGFWFESGTNWIPSAQTIRSGEGFWIENRHSEQPVFLCGALLLDAVHNEDILHGLNAFGYPYPVSVPLAQTDIVDDGAQGGTNIAEADWIVCPEMQATNWLFQSVGHELHNQWLNSTGAISDAVLQHGQGYWYQRSPTNGFTWSVPRPYAADVFSGGSNAPSIVSLVPSADLDAVALAIACTGQGGEILEVFYQDIEAGASFDSAGTWLVADDEIATLGQSNLVWQDTGSAQRPAVSSVYSRVYVVSRQDVDADGDGLSDGREILVHGTDPELLDTDGDGLSDAAEIEDHGTNPLSFDTDDDGMGDGAEVRWSFCPTSSAAYASLPWADDFESLVAGAVHEQNQWVSDPVDAVQVQTGLVKNGLQALEFSSESGGAVLQHYYGAAGADPVWIDMWLRSVPGSLPDIASQSDDRSAVVAVNEDGILCGWDGVASQWIALTNLPSVAGQWIRLTLALDYETRKWSLYVEGLLRIADLGFADNTLREFSRAQWHGSSGLLSSHLDDVTVTDTEPQHLDNDHDGMPNYWERLYGLDVDSDDTAEDPDGDGLTNQEEYALGTNPIQADTDGDGLADGQEMAWGYNPLASNSVHNLPWSCDFEAGEGYEQGALSGQQGWVVSQGNAVVQSNVAFSGTQAAALQSDEPGQSAVVQNIALGSTGQVVWTDLRMRMIPAPLPEGVPDSRYATAVIRLDSSLVLAGFDGTSSAWITATNSPLTKFLSWLHLTVKRDYDAKTWTLYLDGVPVLKDLGFADQTVTRSSLFLVEGGGTDEALDAIGVANEMPLHIDDDNDGISNADEDANDNGVVDVGETDPFNPDTDGDGMDDGRELDCTFDPLSSNDFARLPWNAGFEPGEGYQTGLLDGQQGWLAGSSVFVQTTVVAFGAQAAELQPVEGQGAEMTRHFGAHNEPIVWFETYARLQPGILPDPSDFPNTHSALFAVSPDGLPCAYDGELSEWLVASLDHRVTSEDWTRVVFRLDYRRREWCLYINGVRVFRNVPFLHSTTRALSRARVVIQDASPVTPAVFVDSMVAQAVEPDLLDNDGDGMLNAWEILHGLNPERASDKWGDLDGDGLTNYEEFLYGTDPSDPDTDGDGISDYEEIHQAWSDPSVADFEGELLTLMTLTGDQTTGRFGEWYTEGGVLSGIEPNGYADYLIALPSNTTYVLEVDVRQGNPLTAERNFDVFATVAGLDLGRVPVIAPYGSTATARFFLPRLDAGECPVRILWKTRGVSSVFQIVAVRLMYYPGPDDNQTGLPDWMDHRAENSFEWYPPQESTLVSPICLEGLSIYASEVGVAASHVPEGMETQEVIVGRTVGCGWFANVALSPTSVTEIAVYDPNSVSWHSNTVTWASLDPFEAPSSRILLRVGDSLLLSAGLVNTGGVTDITIPGVTNYSLAADERVAHVFDTPGSFVVDAAYSSGVLTNTQLQVDVVRAVFDGDPICVLSRQRLWDCALVSADTRVEFDPRLVLSRTALAGGGSRFTLKSGTVDRQGLVARLHEEGPILDGAEVRTLYFDSTTARVVARIFTFADGSDMIEVALRFNDVPPDFEIRLVVFIGGVTFEDGTIERIVTAADIDDMGEYRYRLIRAPQQQTSVCHTTEFFQNGAFILNPAR